MTPAARLQASAEILDILSRSKTAPEIVLKTWGQNNRYAGSKDRRAIADRVFQCLRARARLGFFMNEESGRALVIGALHLLDGLSLVEIEALFSGEGYGPKPLLPEERARFETNEDQAPQWLETGLPAFVIERLKAVYGDDWLKEAQGLMLPRAPIDLRVVGDREKLAQGLEMLGYYPELTPFSNHGLRLPADPPPNVRALPAFRQGVIEIQDEGSQLVAFLAGAKPGMTVIDYCAGGGGKTLGLLQVMQGQGRVIASDVEQTRLNNIKPRLARAGCEVEFKLLDEAGGGLESFVDGADLVLVDAPCSGSGVWRRRPEKAHNLTEKEVRRLHELQTAILDRASKLTKVGGKLIYATCSILPDENEETCDSFEASHPNFKPVPISEAVNVPEITVDGGKTLALIARGTHRLRLSPATSNTDGFFVALYQRTS